MAICCRAIHVTKFSNEGTHIFSASDDKTVRYWDMPTQTELNNYSEHTVRL